MYRNCVVKKAAKLSINQVFHFAAIDNRLFIVYWTTLRNIDISIAENREIGNRYWEYRFSSPQTTNVPTCKK